MAKLVPGSLVLLGARPALELCALQTASPSALNGKRCTRFWVQQTQGQCSTHSRILQRGDCRC